MQENKNLVQEALLQMKNVEEAIAQNAKGILASTMKEEINQLVKESLTEQDDEEVDAEVEMDVDDVTSDDMDTDNEDEIDMDVDMDMDMDSDETPIDLTDASDEEILRVFKAMGEEDGIIVKKDGEDIHLKDNDADTEYLVKLGESEEDQNLEEMEMDEMEDVDTQKVIDAIFSNDGGDFEVDQDEEEVMYEIEFDDELDEDEDMMDDSEEMDEEWGGKKGDESKSHKDYMDEDEDMMDESEEMDEDEDMMDESEEMDEDEDMMDESEDMEESEEMDEDDDMLDEAYNHKKAQKAKKSETKEGKNMSVKPKGVGIGKGPKFSYKDKAAGGFNEDKKEGPKSIGTGKAKFEYKKGANMEGKSKVVKKAETKEAARTYGMGSKEGRGLRKITPNRNFVYGKNGVKVESLEAETKMLREKNEEYRKALNVFREKLNEVAIFNSNLAYATRLFTEHSTTKKEKINILRRFDDVESLKESKSLYKSIKDELNKTESKSINESVEKKINNTVSSGSATNLIESKTYENPQFLRMKDLMSKLG